MLAILLRTGIRAGNRVSNALELAQSLLAEFGNLVELNRASLAEISRVPGVGLAKAVGVKAAFELGKRLLTFAPEERPQVSGPRDVYALLRGDMCLLEQESVRVVLLNTRHRVQAVVQVTIGSLNSSTVRVAELFREAVRQQAAAIVLAHNHPSGDPTPSAEDVALTRKANEAGRLLDIEVLDHLIIGQPGAVDGEGWVSLRERHLGFEG